MVVDQLRLRDFRTYERLEVELDAGLTLLCGENGAGKTNLLEGIYFGCTTRSCRTKVDTQTIRFGNSITRVELEGSDDGEPHSIAVGLDRAEGKQLFADGARVQSPNEIDWRPKVVVFMPDRLELVKGAPGIRRAHLDQLIAALWPARAGARNAYARALAQRNALLARGTSGLHGDQLDVWDAEITRHAIELIGHRESAVGELTDRFAQFADALGINSEIALRYRPSGGITDAASFAEALAARRGDDLARGFSTFGPHRDELVISHDGREARTYASQGQQRVLLLALLLAEGQAIRRLGARPPLILLDDVMSELDAARRRLLAESVREIGQVVVTATERDQVPAEAEVDSVLVVTPGAVETV